MESQAPKRVVIESLSPVVDGGRFTVKRIVGDSIFVEADIFCDGHDELECQLLYRHGESGQWISLPMEFIGNNRWGASFQVHVLGLWQFTVAAHIDLFATWKRDLLRRIAVGESSTIDLADGASLIEASAHRAPASEAHELCECAAVLRRSHGSPPILSSRLDELMSRFADRRNQTQVDPPLSIWADRTLARSSAWYEIFPRSWSDQPETHGTLSDVILSLDSISEMGFDVLYLTPIHPIGHSFRKGRNNALIATAMDCGSPWAIGSSDGGHTAIHPSLGTLADFDSLVAAVVSRSMEVALDVAIQCSPDHPWMNEHPEWFRHRSDGSIAYAENPPKKYQDIVPFDFQCEQWRSLWEAIAGIFRFWVGHGVRIFRVDNPHTKPFVFWEWLIHEIHREHPDVLFLAEAFTAPKSMHRLAKLGFTWSYTYFTWRTDKIEMTDYLREVTSLPQTDFFRPHFWPSTPDILHTSLQQGGRAMFLVRAVLASMGAGNYGIYGPAYELLECTPTEPGSEEYLNSEKYEIKHWNRSCVLSIAPLITILNRIRHQEPACFFDRQLQIHRVDHESLLAWSRFDEEHGSRVLSLVDLNPTCVHRATLHLNRPALGLLDTESILAVNLIDSERCLWNPDSIEVECSPERPVAIWRLSPQ